MTLSDRITNIGELYFSPDNDNNVKYRLIHSIMEGFRKIPTEHIPNLFKINKPINIGTSGNSNIYLTWTRITYKSSKLSSPSLCQRELKSFTNEIHISFDISRDGDNKISSEVTLTIPMMCDYEETDPWNVQDLSNQRIPNAMGGYFTTPNGSIKYPITIENPKMITWGKGENKKNKSNQINYSFTFFLSEYPYNTPSAAQIVKLSFDGTTPSSLSIACESANPVLKIDKINPLALIIYMTNMSFEHLEYLLGLIHVEPMNRLQLKALISSWIISLRTRLDELFPELNPVAQCQAYVMRVLVEEPRSTKTLVNHIIDMFSSLNNIHKNSAKYKGLYILMQIRRMLISVFNPQYHPTRENLITKRMITPAMYITTTLDDHISDLLSMIRKYTSEGNRRTTDVAKKIIEEIQKWDKTLYQIISKGVYKQKAGIMVHDAQSGRFYPPSNLTRVAKKLAAELTKDLTCRKLDPTQDKVYCPYDIPEHKDVGLASGLCVICYVVTLFQSEIDKLTHEIFKFVAEFLVKETNSVTYIIIIDTHVIREVSEQLVDELCRTLRYHKRRNYFSRNDFGVTKDPFLKEVRITIGTGRIIQPILVVEDGKLGLTDEVCECLKNKNHCKTWTEFLRNHPDVIELVDVEQHKCALPCIAEDVDTFEKSSNKSLYTYCYLDPSYYVGWVAVHKNLVNCDAAIRGIYSVNHFRGMMTGNRPLPRFQFESGQSLLYAHKLLVTNPMIRSAKISQSGYLEHVWVAYMSLSEGRNQEDGLVVNAGSIKAGLFDGISFRRHLIQSEVFKRTNTTRITNYNSNHRNLDQQGLPFVNSVFVKGDAMVKKTEDITDEKKGVIGKDESEMYYEYYPARVEYVETTDNNVKILTISHRVPQQGDKFTSSHAQKCTFSYLEDEANVPRMMNGQACQFYCNSIANTSRNTNSAHHTPLIYLMSMLTDLDISKEFTIYRSTPLNVNLDVNYNVTRYNNLVTKTREKVDLWPGESTEDISNCSRVMYDPRTGDLIKDVKVVLITYHRLRQLSADKKTICNKGRVYKNNKMSTEKRKNGGSSKIDEMTRNCIISYGASNVTHEVLSEPNTRRTKIYICKTCGMLLTPIREHKQDYFQCTNCIQDYHMTAVIEHETTSVIRTFIQQQLQRNISMVFTM
jgi:DNA-directed RNA polymerase beta subunit